MVLVVGCTDAFVPRCRLATAGAHTLIRSAPLATAAARAADWRPLVIVLLRESCGDSEATFRHIAGAILAILVVIPSEAIDSEELSRVLESALVEADVLRQGQAPR
jgi:hypothetical protein